MVLVVIPALNEAERIGRVIRGLFQHGWANVVVVDDGSTDETAVLAREAGAKVIVHPFNLGQGAALQTGNDWALTQGAEMIVHFDADGQFNPADISGGVEKIKKDGFEVVFGSRFLDERSKIPWLKKWVILPVARFVNWILTGVKLSDVHNGFRILSRQAAKKINITQNEMAHPSEIMTIVREQGFKYAEHPVEVIYLEFGQGIGWGVKIVKDFIFGKFLR